MNRGNLHAWAMLSAALLAIVLSGCKGPAGGNTDAAGANEEEYSDPMSAIIIKTDDGNQADSNQKSSEQTDVHKLNSGSPVSDRQDPEPSDSRGVPFNSSETERQAREFLDHMTLEEKIGQMFIITPEALTGAGVVTRAGETTEAAIRDYPVGGLIFFSQNLENPAQVKEMLANIQTYSRERVGLPMILSVDEEGGTVSRFKGKVEFGIHEIEDMCQVGADGDVSRAYEIGKEIGAYLSELGFNMDNAPCADVLTNPENTVVRKRSFGSDEVLVSRMCREELKGMKEMGITGVLKHYPGHGATAGDTHNGYAYTEASLDTLQKKELIPFKDGAGYGVEFIMAGHISCPNVTKDAVPASLSDQMINGILRGQLNYEGIIITDALNMGAIANEYSSAEAAVKAVKAGVDMLMMPADFKEARNGVIKAVKAGKIPKERIDQSVMRIIQYKINLAGG